MVNGKQYVGQTSRTLEQRWREHCSNGSQCTYLHHAINKYGKENFKVEQIDIALDQEELDYKECQYIKHYNTLAPNGYNLNSGGSLGRKVSKITCHKLSENHHDVSGENNPMYGLKRPEDGNNVILMIRGVKNMLAILKRKEIKVDEHNPNIVVDQFGYNTLAFLADIPKNAMVTGILVDGLHLKSARNIENEVTVDFYRDDVYDGKRVVAVYRYTYDNNGLANLAKSFKPFSFVVEYIETAIAEE